MSKASEKRAKTLNERISTPAFRKGIKAAKARLELSDSLWNLDHGVRLCSSESEAAARALRAAQRVCRKWKGERVFDDPLYTILDALCRAMGEELGDE